MGHRADMERRGVTERREAMAQWADMAQQVVLVAEPQDQEVTGVAELLEGRVPQVGRVLLVAMAQQAVTERPVAWLWAVQAHQAVTALMAQAAWAVAGRQAVTELMDWQV